MKEVQSINDLNEIVKGNKPVLLDFYADWCRPCQTLLPIVERLADKHESNFIIAKINVDKHPELARKYSVRSIPALFFIQGGEVKESLNGLRTEKELDDKIHKYSDLAAR